MQYYLLVRCLIALLFGYVIGGYTNTLEYRLRVGENSNQRVFLSALWKNAAAAGSDTNHFISDSEREMPLL